MASMAYASRPLIAEDEYYHIFNRGARHQNLFRDRSDWLRLLFNILYLQSNHQFTNVSRVIPNYSQEFGFSLPAENLEQVLTTRFVELVSFCIMPNHFHLIVKEVQKNGIATYMQRMIGGYTKYFNTKYETSGYLFQGPYKAVHVKDNRQLLYLSAYIHRNPRELHEWKGREFEYPWSSLQDFTTANRWGGLIVPDIITGQFETTRSSNYADFVRTSTAKLLGEELESLSNLMT
jgi:putative transposase